MVLRQFERYRADVSGSPTDVCDAHNSDPKSRPFDGFDVPVQKDRYLWAIPQEGEYRNCEPCRARLLKWQSRAKRLGCHSLSDGDYITRYVILYLGIPGKGKRRWFPRAFPETSRFGKAIPSVLGSRNWWTISTRLLARRQGCSKGWPPPWFLRRSIGRAKAAIKLLRSLPPIT